MLTDEQLAAIKARCEAASPGPWLWYSTPVRTNPHHRLLSDTARGDILWARMGSIAYDERDAEFIAAAREDVPALLAEVERLQAALRSTLFSYAVHPANYSDQSRIDEMDERMEGRGWSVMGTDVSGNWRIYRRTVYDPASWLKSADLLAEWRLR